MRAEDILPDHQNQVERCGVMIRKGSVGAFLVNAKLWLDPNKPAAERAEAQRDMIAALPALQALGLFDILQVKHEALRQLIETNGGMKKTDD
ncbi:hypothetical protein NUK34_13600 [Kerstersia gyiorum]|uniref:hypothetical protein n=1 Tax=Kerstersia gyiorum TaxID=206506 RepID=UPI001070BC4F|nr:hypothetical protein [Kerstersia gyiorum]MCR4159886.1 hypothetical protein [Kerstersia gyiorum]QBR40259.1 hypothetical protein EHF36_06170 [Kerstersia gyiorum]